MGVDDIHAGDPRLECPGGGPAVALDGELHVLGGQGVAVVERHSAAQDEVIAGAVRRNSPSLAEAWNVSADGLSYDFFMRRGGTFDHDDHLTSEAVKLSIQRH